MTVHYIAFIEPGPGGASAYFPDLPGCASAGADLQEALAGARDALAWHVALMRQDGDLVPQPRSLDAIAADPEHASDMTDVIVAAIPLDHVEDRPAAAE